MKLTPDALDAVIESFEKRLEQAKAGKPELTGDYCPACQWWHAKCGEEECAVEYEDMSTRRCPFLVLCGKYATWYGIWLKGHLAIEDLIDELEAEIDKLERER